MSFPIPHEYMIFNEEFFTNLSQGCKEFDGIGNDYSICERSDENPNWDADKDIAVIPIPSPRKDGTTRITKPSGRRSLTQVYFVDIQDIPVGQRYSMFPSKRISCHPTFLADF